MSFFEALQSEVSILLFNTFNRVFHGLQTLDANLSPVEMGIE